MIDINSGQAARAERPRNSRSRFVHRLSEHPITVIATVLMLVVGFGIPNKVYAQASQDTASCIDKCKSDEKGCLHNGSSEELCEYDSKQCQKTCSEGK
jgi:hypothetical protein